MAGDFIEMNHDELMKQIANLDRKLSEMDEKISGEISDRVIKEAAFQLHNEQKRLLSQAPTPGIRRLASDLSVWKSSKGETSGKVSYRTGYSDDKISKSIKYFVVEFGRPGKKNKQKDKKGRRIGRVEPYSHIRAAKFTLGDSINKFIAERINSEIDKKWKE